MKKKCGRPTKYRGEETIALVRNYTANANTSKIPKIYDLIEVLGMSLSEIYDWRAQYPEFRKALEELKAKQAAFLIDNGLKGTYNASIAKLLLTKHGYSDRQEVDQTVRLENLSDEQKEKLNKIL